ncbi:MAG: UDP-2,3-diacylglucosamine diphosphatase, partial [Gammaproteobacteria bacterium]|nr:UDP-2,3-diacylglucosamine diphosphatase [Gammaproteobacteria bacterium]
DEFLRRYSGLELGSFKLTDEAEYTTKAGQKLLVIHGDQFDFVSKSSRWLAMVGDLGYRFLFSINHWLNKWRSRYGYEYWSLSDWAKSRVKRVVNFLGKFEKLVAQECNQRGFQGIVCGHIHKPEISDINGTKYYNCGDWVESCSALIEDETGQLEIYRWQEHDSQVITFPTSRAVGE